MGRNILTLVDSEHRHLEGLATRACEARRGRTAVDAELLTAASAHHAAMAEIVRELLSTHPELAAAAEQLRSVDAELVVAITSLSALGAGTTGLPDAVDRVSDLLGRHWAAEEPFLAVAAGLDLVRLRQLGGSYVRRRDAARRTGNPHRVPRRLDVTRADLYEQARRAGIVRRATMSRAELIAALDRQRASS